MCDMHIEHEACLYGIRLCSKCASIIKGNLRDLNSKDMRKFGIFLIYWAGLKQFIEEQNLRREKRKQKVLEEKLHVKNL